MCGMRVISRKDLREFSQRFPDAKSRLDAWYCEANKATWKTPIDIKKMYGNASILKENRVVFNICGNKYRIITKINFDHGIIRIRFIGTHKEYNKVNAEEV